ncbi:MAG: NAD(+)/NADH kinase [Syntrophales bacterium]|nr:NAD(+)/NADH kinase [Syntrophales bacterium]
MGIRKIGIIANTAKEKSGEYTLRLRDWIIERGLEVFFHKEIAAKIGENRGYERKELAAMVDLLAVFGGDGTLLRTARAVRKFQVPIVGINLGEFGYLTEVNLNEMLDAFEVILQGRHQTDRRMMLDVSIKTEGEKEQERTILNDAVINRGNLSRIVDLETFVDDRYLTTFKADGLIISTPTGSTAYSLSAGGPIVFPQHNSIIINPICPHTLTNRPIILPGDSRIKVTLWSKGEGATLTLDGQVCINMKSGDTMNITKSSNETILVCSPHRDYLEILRSKLGWGGLPAVLRKS